MEQVEHPPSGLPHFLRGLRFPSSPDEAYIHAQTHGANPEDLEFLEALPAAAFSSEAGLKHAFSAMGEHVPRRHYRGAYPSHDGDAG